VPYLSTSGVVIHYEEALYQVYAPLPLHKQSPLLVQPYKHYLFSVLNSLLVCFYTVAEVTSNYQLENLSKNNF